MRGRGRPVLLDVHLPNGRDQVQDPGEGRGRRPGGGGQADGGEGGGGGPLQRDHPGSDQNIPSKCCPLHCLRVD